MRDGLTLQNLLPLLSNVAGSDQKLVVRKWPCYRAMAREPNAGRTAVDAAEQVRAATGVDLNQMAKRFGA